MIGQSVEQPPLSVQDDDPVILVAGNAAEEQILLPQGPAPGADGQGLLKGGVERLRPEVTRKASRPIPRARVWVTISPTTMR